MLNKTVEVLLALLLVSMLLACNRSDVGANVSPPRNWPLPKLLAPLNAKSAYIPRFVSQWKNSSERIVYFEEVTIDGYNHYMFAFTSQLSFHELGMHTDGILIPAGFARTPQSHESMIVYANKDRSIIVKIQEWYDVNPEGVIDDCFTYSVLQSP